MVIIFVMSDATVLTRYGSLLLLLLFLMQVFLSYVLSLICEAVLCLELVFWDRRIINKIYYLLLLEYERLFRIMDWPRPQELCESRGGRPGLPVPNSLHGLCGRKATLQVEEEWK